MDRLLEAVSNPANTIEKLAEGKTKEILAIKGFPDLVLVKSKDQLTAFNAQRKNDLEGKGAIANQTTVNVFKYLSHVGLQTHFVCGVSPVDFVARHCEMIPIEWVIRRVATGSFLKRNPGVKQGHRFSPAKVETFFKDDANDDPQWSDEQIVSAGFTFNGVTIGRAEIALMKRMSVIVFECLEKGWQLNKCALIDMKIEFGVSKCGSIVLADVIDNDSWRVWPEGDKRMQLDKQFYRDLDEVTEESLKQLIANYEKVCDLTGKFAAAPLGRALVIMGSGADRPHCEKIVERLNALGVPAVMRVSSAHKSTSETLELVAEFESLPGPTVVVAVAGRSNGLGPVIAGNSTLPVINCPPVSSDWAAQDIWSSLRTPSGLGCSTVIGADEAGLCAAKIIAQQDHMVHCRVLCEQLNNLIAIYKADKQCVDEQ